MGPQVPLCFEPKVKGLAPGRVIAAPCESEQDWVSLTGFWEVWLRQCVHGRDGIGLGATGVF